MQNTNLQPYGIVDTYPPCPPAGGTPRFPASTALGAAWAVSPAQAAVTARTSSARVQAAPAVTEQSVALRLEPLGDSNLC
jgi:hypothetical protein